MMSLPACSFEHPHPVATSSLAGAAWPNHLIAKLERFTRLAPADRAALIEITARRRQIGAQEDIVREGEAHGPLRVILEGWACRFKQLEDGRRQITAILLPGDLCDTHVNVLCEMDHSISAITPVVLAEISRDRLDTLVGQHPHIGLALWWDMLAAGSIQREWMVNLGQRDAAERLGHLFCEIFHRLQAVGLTQGFSCEMPLRQMDLAGITGVTSVHVNRCLQALRSEGLIALKNRRLTIPDLTALQRASLFSQAYLHFDGHRAAAAGGERVP